jgi:adenosine deaminase
MLSSVRSEIKVVDESMTRMPKVELHLHLDCSLSYEAVARLDCSISRREFEVEFVAPAQCTSLADFLTRAPRGFRLMQTKEALQIAIEDLFQQLQVDQVVYAEIRFAPLLHLERGLTPESAVAAIDRATEECTDATGIEARLILCTLRHFNREQSLLTAKLVECFRGSRVVALDLAGDEAGFPIDPHVAAFHYALDHGLARTAHAGEAGGAESIWETLRAFRPSRIGHGARCVEDPDLLEHLRRERIHLEVCPSSNVQTRVCASYREHPAGQLLRAGVSLGINTDARTITNVTLEQEYARLREYLGWSDAELVICNHEALRAAFVEDSVKSRLLSRLKSISPSGPST